MGLNSYPVPLNDYLTIKVSPKTDIKYNIEIFNYAKFLMLRQDSVMNTIVLYVAFYSWKVTC